MVSRPIRKWITGCRTSGKGQGHRVGAISRRSQRLLKVPRSPIGIAEQPEHCGLPGQAHDPDGHSEDQVHQMVAPAIAASQRFLQMLMGRNEFPTQRPGGSQQKVGHSEILQIPAALSQAEELLAKL